MNIECEVYGNGEAVVVSFDTDGYQFGMGACIGRKKFGKKPGTFTYQWVATDLMKEDLYELVQAILFVIDHMPDEPDVCDECVAEQVKVKEGK